MLKSKSFIVNGETIHRNGQAEKNIAQKVDECINSFLKDVEGEFVDLKIDAKVNPGVGTDTAFITIVVKVDGQKSIEEPSESPVGRRKK